LYIYQNLVYSSACSYIYQNISYYKVCPFTAYLIATQQSVAIKKGYWILVHLITTAVCGYK
jgi:hypothetical protein